MKRYILEPNLDKSHIEEGYENVCDDCAYWGEACETCDVCIPVVIDEHFIVEVEYDIMTLCEIPVGAPYEVGERKIVGILNADGIVIL